MSVNVPLKGRGLRRSVGLPFNKGYRFMGHLHSENSQVGMGSGLTVRGLTP